jgi:hypothetical protein
VTRHRDGRERKKRPITRIVRQPRRRAKRLRSGHYASRAPKQSRYDHRAPGRPPSADSAGPKAMVWLLNLYVIMSLVVSVSAAFHVGTAAGVYAVLTIAIALIAGGGLKATLFWGNTVQKFGGPL